MFNLEQTKKYLLKICLDVSPFSPDSFKKSRQTWVKNGTIVALDDDGYQNKQSAIAEILKDPFIRDHIPESHVEDSINAIIGETIKQPVTKREGFLKSQLKILDSNLRSEIQDWVFLIPIENFEFERKTQFGCITFHVAKKQEENVRRLFKRILKNNIHYTKEEKEQLIVNQLNEFRKTALNVTCFAEVKTTGILDSAYQESLKKVRLALNIYRLYYSQRDDEHKSNFGIKGEIVPRNIRYTMRYKADKKELRPFVERIGYIFPFKLDKKRLEYMRNNGFYKLRAIFSKCDKSEFENRILTAIYWYGEAINCQILHEKSSELVGMKMKKSKFDKFEFFDITQRVLTLMISLESILIFNDSESLRVNVSERVAFLLSNQYADRKKIKTRMTQFYDIRSKIVHHGEMYVSLKDANELTLIVQSVLFSILLLKTKAHLINHNDLQEYFEKVKLG